MMDLALLLTLIAGQVRMLIIFIDEFLDMISGSNQNIILGLTVKSKICFDSNSKFVLNNSFESKQILGLTRFVLILRNH